MLTFPLLHWIQRSVASLWGLVCGGVLGGITGVWSPLPGGIWCSFQWFLLSWPSRDPPFVYLLTLLHCSFSSLLLTARLYPYLLYTQVLLACIRHYLVFVSPKTSSVQLQVFFFFSCLFLWVLNRKWWKSVHSCGFIHTKHCSHLLPPHVSIYLCLFLYPHFAGTLLSYQGCIFCTTTLCVSHKYLILPTEAFQTHYNNVNWY